MRQRDFWLGFTWGAAAGSAATLVAQYGRRGGRGRVVRIEKSLQIARPPQEVFDVFSNLDQLPTMSKTIDSVSSRGQRSHWKSSIAGATVEWDARLTQLIPNQAIGWKSVRGPKHSGRITFSPLENDTLVHVQMNYIPSTRLSRAFGLRKSEVESSVDEALRDVKSWLESQPRTADTERRHQNALGRATGSYGPGPELVAEQQNPKFGAPSTPIEYTAPPRAKR